MEVRVVNVAPGGMGLLAPSAPETGTCLRLEWSATAGKPRRSLEVRVLQAASQDGGGWLLGCELAAQVDAADLQALREGTPQV
jgi:hypothetical protein